MITVATITDKYNELKQWTVLKSKCGHYTLVQTVAGNITGQARVGINQIRNILDWAVI